MGGRKFQCEDCDEVTYLYNSCGNRDCPQCSGARRHGFNQSAAKRIIDGVAYYQVTMTLPSELSELALYNREAFAKLLPKAAWSATRRCIESQQGYRAGAISVLHTWNQKLENHWHVHLLAPGAGPSIDGQEWISARPPAGHHNNDGFYLVDSERLKEKYRNSFILRLDRMRKSGMLNLSGRFAHLQDDANWKVFKERLRQVKWVAHIQPPPTNKSLAHHVVNYLTRYVAGGPMSDGRIVKADVRNVTFMAREGKRIGGERKQVPITLTTREFTNRWTEHLQPAGLTRVRYFGGWSCSKVAAYQEQCRDLMPFKNDEASNAQMLDEMEHSVEHSVPDLVCEHCGSDRMVLIESTAKPSWRDVLGYQSESVPYWYAEARNEDNKRFWDAAMGEGFNAWYLETFIESAKGRPASESPPEQLWLPVQKSLGIETGYPLNSF